MGRASSVTVTRTATQISASAATRKRVLRSAAGSFGLMVGWTGLAFLSNVVLARLLGAEGLGMYAAVLALVTVLAAVATLGLDKLLVREVAAGASRGSWTDVAGLIRFANVAILAASVVIALAVALIAYLIPGDGGSTGFQVLLVALPLIGIIALARARTSTLQGLHHVVISQLPEYIVRPTLVIAFVVATIVVLPAAFASAQWAMLLTLVATAVAFVLGVVFLLQRRPAELRGATPRYTRRAWMSAALPLTIMGAVATFSAQSDLLVLSALKGGEAAGIYAVAIRAASLVAFGLAAVNASLSPTASALWAQGDVAELQRLATSGSRAALGTTALLVAGIVVFAEPLLLVFGPEFRAGSTALVILAAGQLVNAFTGSVGALLVMTGHERDVAAGLAVGVATGIVLDLLLIPGLGITGAAIGGAAAMSVWNVTLSVVLYKRLGIHATALGPIRLRRRGGAA